RLERALAGQHGFALGVLDPGFVGDGVGGGVNFGDLGNGFVGLVEVDGGHKGDVLHGPHGAKAGGVHAKNAGEFGHRDHAVGDLRLEDGGFGVFGVVVDGVPVAGDFGKLFHVGVGDGVVLDEALADLNVFNGQAVAGFFGGIGGH